MFNRIDFYYETLKVIVKCFGYQDYMKKIYSDNKKYNKHQFITAYNTLKELNINISKRNFEVLSLIYFMDYSKYRQSPHIFHEKIMEYVDE